jgi:D-serine deaminase-like pyridoxal phosphate-dependent protein
MATLTATVGAVTSTVTTTNANALAIIGDYVIANNGPVNGTNQEKLDWYVRELAKHTKAVANAQGIATLVEAERVTATATLASRDWV